jgi:hypothetical protein
MLLQVRDLPPQSDPCKGVKASDLDYSVVRYRGNEADGRYINENAIDHITRRHIQLDDRTRGFLTESRLPIAAQSSSKYIFQNNVTTLKDARQLVIAANAEVFKLKKSSYYMHEGNIIMSYVFPPVLNAKGGVFTGMGYDIKRGWGLPTNALTLVLDGDCKEVKTSYPGLP